MSDRGLAAPPPHVGPRLLVARTDCGGTPRGTTTTTTTNRLRNTKGYRTHRPYVRSQVRVATPSSAPLPYIRPSVCVRARRTPVRRSRFSVDGGRVATPGSAPLLQTGTIRGDRTCRIFRSASSRSGSLGKPVERYLEARMFRTYGSPELILPISSERRLCDTAGRMHCEIVHWVFGRLSQREAWVAKGREHPPAVRVGLVIPALSFVISFGNGTNAEAV